MVEAGLIASRFVHYAAVMALFGASFFPLYSYASRNPQWSARLERYLHAIVFGAAVAAVLSALTWLACTTAVMAGTPSAATDWDMLWSVLSETTFGHVWIVRLALMIVILSATGLRAAANANGRRDVSTPLLAGLLLASLAFVGHTQQNDWLAWLVHLGADGVHLLSAGAWLGGLLALALVLTPSFATDPAVTESILLRFSGMGYVAVALLVASGTVNSWYLVGSFAGLVETAYGQLLLLKLCLFAGMLALAASNRFWLIPALMSKGETTRARDTVARLRRHVLGEEALGLIVILIVSALGTMEPAVNR